MQLQHRVQSSSSGDIYVIGMLQTDIHAPYMRAAVQTRLLESTWGTWDAGLSKGLAACMYAYPAMRAQLVTGCT